MSLDRRKLEAVRELAGGLLQARCPACAESGADRRGEHLRIQPDGRFGCCVHPKDREHRKRIFALAGDRQPTGRFTVRVAGRQSPSSAAQSVKQALHALAGTVGTAKSESESTREEASQVIPAVEANRLTSLGTLGTAISNPRAYAGENISHTCKDSESGVPSVLKCLHTATERLPHFTPGGTLVIPFEAPERFHWWKGGQSIAETRREVLADGHHSIHPDSRKETHEITV